MRACLTTPKKQQLSTIQCYSLVVALEIFVWVMLSTLHSLYIYVNASLYTIIYMYLNIETESSGRCLSHCHANTVNLVTVLFSPSRLSSLALSLQILLSFTHIPFYLQYFCFLFLFFTHSIQMHHQNEQKLNRNNSKTTNEKKNTKAKPQPHSSNGGFYFTRHLQSV